MPTIPPEQISSPASADGAERIEPIVVGVGRADAGIESPAGVQIVIDPVHAARLQPPRLFEVNSPTEKQIRSP